MTQKYLPLTTLLLASLALAAAPAMSPTTKPDMTPRLAENTVVTPNVPYVASATEKQTLDIYAPRDAKNARIILFVHGGEWTKGDKLEISYKPQFFNTHKIIFAATNYRLNPADNHPAQVNDLAAAVRYLHDNAAKYGGDPKKIILLGHSAGCHLVTLVALDTRPLATVGLKPSDLAAVVSWSGGAFDLVDKVHSGGTYAGYIHNNFGPEESAWRDASPKSHINDADNKPLPPFLFASADQGNPASHVASDQMAELIRAAGGKTETLVLQNRDHTGANHLLGSPGDTTGPDLLKFLNTVLPGQGSQTRSE